MAASEKEKTFSTMVPYEEGYSREHARENVTVLSGGDVVMGEVVAKVLATVPTTGTADGGNTGDGTVSAVTGDRGTQVGIYSITCVEVAQGGGVFEVTDPNGNLLERVTLTAGALTVPTTGTADGGNTGNGTVTSVTGDNGTQIGTYRLECVETVTNGGVFIVRDPIGNQIDRGEITAGAGGTLTIANNEINATVTDAGTDFAEGDFFTIAVTQADSGTGTIANNELNGTITDGATDFVLADVFTVTVAAGSGKIVPVAFSATDGSQLAYGIMTDAVDASAADVVGVAVVRDAEAVSANLTWPAGASAAQKTQAFVDFNNIIAVEAH